MPILNSRGDVLAGGGGSQGSLNGVPYPFASSGRGCAPDETTILVQVLPQNALALWWFRDSGPPVILVPARGANAMAGGGSRWLADGNGVMFGSLGEIRGAALIGASLDGTLAYYPNAGSGIGLVISDPNGTRHDYPSVIAKPAPWVVGPGQVIWDGGAAGREPAKPAIRNASGVQLVTVAGEEWLVYWAEGVGLIAQPNGAAAGWVLDTRPLEFNYYTAVVNGELWLTWSTTAGERPQDIVVCVITRTAVTYRRTASDWTPQTPVWRVLTAAPPEPKPPHTLPPQPPTKPPQEITMDAPNRQATIAKYVALHPDWAKDEVLRGQIIDLSNADDNVLDGGRWGRKSRNPQGTDLNTDGKCWKRADGKHEIYDAIGGNGTATWEPFGPFAPGENGYWVPSPVTTPSEPTDPPLPGGSDAITAAIRALIAAEVKPLQAEVAALRQRIVALEARPTGDGSASIDGARIAIRTDNGHYLTAEGGGGGDVNASRPNVGGGWEIFTLVRP